MEEAIIHLLKSAGLMSLFYAGYFFLLKNDTSFKTNRFFLLAGIITSTLLPFLEITRTVKVKETSNAFLYESFSAEPYSTAVQPEALDWWKIAGILYLAGLSFFLLKFFLELFSLLKIFFTRKAIRKDGYRLIYRSGSHPFSFFKYVVLDPEQHSENEIDLILKHERAHVRQWHSFDQLLSSLSAYLLWFNPLAWLYRKSLVQNLEFLADKEVVAAKVSKKEYQKTLLKISVGGFQPALSNQFYQSLIKKRIMMINKNTTPESNFWKVSLLLPFLSLFVLLFNVETVAQVTDDKDVEKEVSTEVEMAVTISKDTKQENLSRFEKTFGKRGVQLKFENPTFSKNGLLTAVNITYFDKTTNMSGNLSLNNSDGIETTQIFTNAKETGFRKPNIETNASDVVVDTLKRNPIRVEKDKTSLSIGLGNKREQKDSIKKFKDLKIVDPKDDIIAIQSENEKAQIYFVQETKPLVIIDGVEKENFNSSEVDPSKIKAIKVLKGEDAVEKYGERAEDGAVEIELKSKEEPQKKTVSSETFSEPVTLRMTKIQYKERKKLSVRDVGSADPDDLVRLYVVDGKIMASDFDPGTIAPENIESVTVLKDKKATAKYGKKASGGVIEITTRK